MPSQIARHPSTLHADPVLTRRQAPTPTTRDERKQPSPPVRRRDPIKPAATTSRMRSILPRSHAAHEIPRDVVSRTGRAGVSTAALRLFQLNVRSRPNGSATAVKPPPLLSGSRRPAVPCAGLSAGRGSGGSGSRSCSVTPIRMSTSPPPDGRLRPCSARGSAWRRGWRATKEHDSMRRRRCRKRSRARPTWPGRSPSRAWRWRATSPGQTVVGDRRSDRSHLKHHQSRSHWYTANLSQGSNHDFIRGGVATLPRNTLLSARNRRGVISRGRT